MQNHTRLRAHAWPLLALIFSSLAVAATPSQPYRVGQPVPVSCVNRETDTGEHKTDAEGRIEYVPFPKCSETGKPLQLYFGVEGGIILHSPALILRVLTPTDVNCTIDFVDDPFFHLLEFYVVRLSQSSQHRLQPFTNASSTTTPQ